ncbi:Retrovirus-related Pol polyprotein type-2 like protein [Argiope bruennichi]|uniref:Retrovirus-related Pol polyprotein type-2 like protein n=1 Tax=Argiope bruennichi TaxID=94029 RepID=A0A8T0FCK2_ARGBR|nr:Retrovirus-related Pol polyprotein type-2 like protein [Argiope bruennichi]
MTPGKCSLPALPARRTSPSPEVKVATLWGPILYEEIQRNIPALNSAAVPDRMTPAHLRKLPWEFLCKIMNLFLWCRRVPASLLAARTVFIPKFTSPTSPDELSPNLNGNVLVRLFSSDIGPTVLGQQLSLTHAKRDLRLWMSPVGVTRKPDHFWFLGVGNTPIPPSVWMRSGTYLGVPFTPTGKAKVKILENLRPKLEVLTKAPLKPQQRLFFLRCHLLPSVYHLLALGKAGPSSLKRADTVVRGFIRKWLDLPVDTPVPFYYADVEDGGLGVPCLLWSGVRLRLDRLNYFNHILAFRDVSCSRFNNFNYSTDPAGQVSSNYIERQRSKVNKVYSKTELFMIQK